MTPLEGELLQRLALDHLQNIVGLSISGFFYGVFSSLVVCGSSTSSISGVFVVLFSASVVIFAFVLSFCKPLISKPAPNLQAERVF